MLKEVVKIIEGKAILNVSENYYKKTTFYNPISEISRDITVIFIDNLEKNDIVCCDALSGIGARGIRICKETNKIKEIWFNDYSKDAFEFIKMNVKENGLENISKVFNKDANVLLSENKRVFDYIDIDPFGSPIYFYDSCARAIKRKGYIGFTATDTQALTGSNKRACLRKYGINCFRNDMMHEIGIRNLISSIALNFSKYMFSIKPILSINKNHFYRVFVYLEKGRKKAIKNIEENVGFVHYCKNCLFRKFSKEIKEFCENCSKKIEMIFPTWIGETFEKSFVEKILQNIEKFSYLKNFKEIRKTFEILSKEINAPCYDMHEISSKYKVQLVKREKLIESLANSSLVHHSPTSIKTFSNINEILEIWKEILNFKAN